MKRPIYSKKIGLITLCLAMLVGAIVYYSSAKSTVINEPVIVYSTNQPDESVEKAQSYQWRGKPDEPKKIIIQDINLESFVQQSGVDQYQKIAVPNNVHLASWFVNSSKPGQAGLSIIAGHVKGRVGDGVFKNLDQLNIDTEFTVELGDGSIKKYKVISSRTVDEAAAAEVLYSQNPKVKSQLNLITCGGEFDTSSNQYNKRVIVESELVE